MVHLVSNLVILMHRNMIFGMMFLPYTCSYILRRILKMKCMLKIISITFQYGLILIKGLITIFFYKQWYQIGVKTLGDFLSNDGYFLLKKIFLQKFI